MRIAAVLADKGSSVATVATTTTVTEAVAELARLGIGALVVSDDGRHIDGIVSERDVVRRMAIDGGSIADERVSSIMSTTVHTCSPSDSTEHLRKIMTDHRVRHVPVVDGGILCGLVSIGDVVKAHITELERDRKELEDYITAR